MKFNELPKQKRLLIYMFNYECSTECGITVADNGDDIIAHGISKNKNSLSNMLHTLLVKHDIGVNKTNHCYFLTRAGQDEAKRWIERCDEDEWFPGDAEQPSENEEAVGVDWASLANMFADVANKFAQQPTQNDRLQEENTALTEEVESLKATIGNMRANMTRLSYALDAKTKECERLKKGLDQIADAFKKSVDWAFAIRDGRG